jgi:hypothetical protein
MNKAQFMLSLFLSLGSGWVLAHQPRIDFHTGTLTDPVVVEEPEISKAYYGELKGNEEYFEIDSKKELLLYLNILAPDIEGARTDFKVDVLKDNSVIFTLDENNWKKFYEPFGGDNYLRGPELEEQVSSGTYLIKVSNPDNLGKYSLAVGKTESFPFIEIVKTYIVLPKLKKDFFGKSPFTAYFNYCGMFLLIILVLLVIIILVLVYFVKRYKRKRRE